MSNVYITKSSTYLPNEPIANDDMETYLGLVNNTPSKARALILRNNQIKTRYYALDKNGQPTHTNAQITANAINGLFDENFKKIWNCCLAEQRLQTKYSRLTHQWFTVNWV